ncbi:MAG TPA: hypothetical protein VMR86_06330 [Myxococcota bacterium]|nr:hypothetical protein [Myxococcota bacterium]
MAAGEGEAGVPRRAFLETRELPELVFGVALAQPAACRRVLGARRGGRVGFVLACVLLALAAPSARFAAAMLALHVVLTLGAGLAGRPTRSHTTREVQRLALWTALVPLAIAALARPFFGPGGGTLLPAAVVTGQLLLWRALAASRSSRKS